MKQTNTIQQDYIFETKRELPLGEVKVTVLKGDAWIFTDKSNFILHTGEQRTLSTQVKAPHIRRAYTRGFAKLQIEVVA